MYSKTIDVVIDLQYGSTGKGLLVGWLAERGTHDTIMSAWAPNAGHTYIDSMGRKFIHTMLPNGIVGSCVQRVMMGPGSVIDMDKLSEEIDACEDILRRNLISIFIHPNAAVVTQEDRDIEYKTMTAIGSTKKGVGEAVINKIRRNPDRPSVISQFEGKHLLLDRDNVHVVRSTAEWLAIYSSSRKVLVEGAQGFGLSINHGFYPYTTSRDVTPSQIMADCGIPFSDARKARIHGTCRTYPIRVANRFDENGTQVGWSGPCYPDQAEISWQDIGLEPELTTVTKLPRRLFTFSNQQINVAMSVCDPSTVFLNFVNYVQSYDLFERIWWNFRDVPELIIGVGPTYNDVLTYDHGSPTKLWAAIQERLGKW